MTTDDKLRALLLPYVALTEARLNALWPSKGAIRVGQIASAQVVREAQQIIRAGIDGDISPLVAQAIDDVGDVLNEQVRKARLLLANAKTEAEARDAIKAINFAVHRVLRINAFVEVTHQVDQQIKERKSDEVLVWVPEREACPACLRMAGDIKHRPPLHPNCRCTLMKLPRSQSKGRIRGLKLEAQRLIRLHA